LDVASAALVLSALSYAGEFRRHSVIRIHATAKWLPRPLRFAFPLQVKQFSGAAGLVAIATALASPTFSFLFALF
jgi:hypothetical protein